MMKLVQNMVNMESAKNLKNAMNQQENTAIANLLAKIRIVKEKIVTMTTMMIKIAKEKIVIKNVKENTKKIVKSVVMGKRKAKEKTKISAKKVQKDTLDLSDLPDPEDLKNPAELLRKTMDNSPYYSFANTLQSSANGKYLVIGNPFSFMHNSSGIVVVYKKDIRQSGAKAKWKFMQRLVPVFDNRQVSFGTAVSINDAGTLISCSAKEIDWHTSHVTDLVILFGLSNGTWVKSLELGISSSNTIASRSSLQSPNFYYTNQYGQGSILSGDGSRMFMSAIGSIKLIAEGESVSIEFVAGSVFVINLDISTTSDTWSFLQRIQLTNRNDSSLFGKAIACSKDASTLAVGNPDSYYITSYNESEFGVGEVFIYKYNGSEYVAIQQLSPERDEDVSKYFGKSIAINTDGTIIVIGSPSENSASNYTDCGAVYIAKIIGDEWVIIQTILPPSRTNINAEFGYVNIRTNILGQTVDYLTIGTVVFPVSLHSGSDTFEVFKLMHGSVDLYLRNQTESQKFIFNKSSKEYSSPELTPMLTIENADDPKRFTKVLENYNYSISRGDKFGFTSSISVRGRITISSFNQGLNDYLTDTHSIINVIDPCLKKKITTFIMC
mgnify:CR=1 FL=1